MKERTKLILIILIFIGAYYIQVDDSSKTQNSHQVLLQLQHRNSDGQLVSYVEGSKIAFINPDKLNEFLDKLPNKKIIEKNGKDYDMFQWIGPSEKYARHHSWSGYELRVLPVNGNYQTVLMVLHNAYETQPGDTASIRWTVLRPIL